MITLKPFDALGGGNDAHHHDIVRAMSFHQADRLRCRASGGEHGIEAQHEASVEIRQFAIVTVSYRSVVMAFQADISHADIREKVDDGFEHSQTRPQNWHRG